MLLNTLQGSQVDIWGKSFPGQGTACAKNVSWEHAWCVINEGEESLGSWGQKQVERSLREDQLYMILSEAPWDTGKKNNNSKTLILHSRNVHSEQKGKITMSKTVNMSRTQRLGGLFWGVAGLQGQRECGNGEKALLPRELNISGHPMSR